MDPAAVQIVTEDGGAEAGEVLAGLWSAWMKSASTQASSAGLASSVLKPYPHQYEAVYGRMLPQPVLRFLLGDEPGTGKTIMAGLYAREAQRIGMVDRCLVVCPAHLVSKWIADFDRFFGQDVLRRIKSSTVRERALEPNLEVGHKFWVVSLELAATNPAVQDAIRPERAGWDLVIMDEAHRLTPSAAQYFTLGRVLHTAPSFLAMTATPHRGNEEYFRALMHLVDPDVFPDLAGTLTNDDALKPGSLHLLRRMKEELYGYDGQQRLFHERHAENLHVSMRPSEQIIYNEALSHVDAFLPDDARTLGRIVYGKRCASSLASLRSTLARRKDLMGDKNQTEARHDPLLGDPDDEDPAAADHAQIVYARSKNSRAEKAAIGHLIERIDAELDDTYPADQSSKWQPVIDQCLLANSIEPGGNDQAVVFTEYADTADWLVELFRSAGFTAERYSGRDNHQQRDDVRLRFMAGEFQIIVSTDAGNEGIDLQSAHVLVNWDIPWSLVTLEQRMGRIHRVGQTRDVLLYNVIATGTLEGDTYARLLDRLVEAANEMGGKMFDCLTLVGERLFANQEFPVVALFGGPDDRARAIEAINKITKEQLRIEAERALRDSQQFNTPVDLLAAVRAIQNGELERINPHVVEWFCTRLRDAGLIGFTPSSLASDLGGLFNLGGSRTFEPSTLLKPTGAEKATLVATFADARTKAVEQGSIQAGAAVLLGPAEEPFRQLATDTFARLRPALMRGATLQDPTGIADYTLFLYETQVHDGSRGTISWYHLIRSDRTGARIVPFEMLANLTTGNTQAKPPPPAVRHDADQAVQATIVATIADRVETLTRWREDARQQLERLPHELVRNITDRDRRRQIRAELDRTLTARKHRLELATSVTASEPSLIGWASVAASGVPDNPTEADSELIAVRLVDSMLTTAGWKVTDVQTDGKGYDLEARKGHMLRAVEVKGIWNRAASEGVRLTGNEIVKAGLLGDDYWLYVIDLCSNRTGQLFAAYQNPAKVFDGLGKDVPVLRITGSDLSRKKDEQPQP